ncbi:MAG: rod shape-determining protein [Candidatus Levybacteria bacterium RIFCSPHIGHO2_12_FULL_39_39]|uniref:Cell shape-determining protein MreB n=1 Tax=Candidatus Woesebacteria bacterium GW2011_GWA1_43_12 TaxID=1618557 RepID=A0A0G1FT86_9BACT|nr:MAG: Cell shape determining protein, MreB/Mrl family [Candidatus Levybacteria bacterium GW2011_GWB1_39_7]KKS90003.1 MAG: Cell shape determining protein, MreB/Mrl family [Candidatus Woesebacteria bacterium GW2011_GWA1_43_12]OGH25769.1 MAG: rod shape-determining protein [Candidatus Levybacteria bacterium RIFCSPHIGHO2_12_FULL_39_39]OGH46995.1 MAG: rod shape-determining protein [Candidatus Levybacteria bacterium RIFCSPLOWO2_12_FULL_39_17]
MFDSLFSLFSHDLGIDLGTANILVHVRGKGIAIREPSIVARHNKTKKIIAVGAEAKKMLGKTPGTISAIKPLEHGVISDFDAASYMLQYYIKKVHEVGTPFYQLARPRVAVGIPSGVTEVERRAVWEAALQAGARECYLIEEPMAAAVGAGVSVFEPTGIMLVDIGGGTTEIAVISLGGIVVNRSLKIAGNEMDQAIINYIRLRHGLLIGEKTAEEVKIKIGSAYKQNKKSTLRLRSGREIKNQPRLDRGQKLEESEVKNEEKQMKKNDMEDVAIDEGLGKERIAIIRGRDIETGLPKSLRMNEIEIREAIGPIISQIIDSVMEVLEETPPELTGDILEHGIMVTGGGSLIPGIDELITERSRIPVILVEDPLTTVVRGTARLLEEPNLLNQVKVTGGLR